MPEKENLLRPEISAQKNRGKWRIKNMNNDDWNSSWSMISCSAVPLVLYRRVDGGSMKNVPKPPTYRPRTPSVTTYIADTDSLYNLLEGRLVLSTVHTLSPTGGLHIVLYILDVETEQGTSTGPCKKSHIPRIPWQGSEGSCSEWSDEHPHESTCDWVGTRIMRALQFTGLLRQLLPPAVIMEAAKCHIRKK